MDRIDAMKVFVSAVDEGSLAGAGRRLRSSPGGREPRDRLPRGACRRRTASSHHPLAQAERGRRALCRRLPPRPGRSRGGRHRSPAGERSAPRGTLTITAPIITGEDVLRPILDAFMNEYPTVSVRLYLLDRPVNLIDEGIDVALRIAHLADSNFVAIRLGEVRRVIAASPGYLAQHPVINEPADLAKHQIIAMTHFGTGFLELPAARRLVRSASRAVRAAAGRQHGSRGGRLGGGRTRRDAAVLLSHRRRDPGWTAANPARQGRTPAAAACICSPRKGVSRCPRCAPLSTLPCPASSGISPGCRTRPAGTPAPFVRARGRVSAE